MHNTNSKYLTQITYTVWVFFIEQLCQGLPNPAAYLPSLNGRRNVLGRGEWSPLYFGIHIS